MSGTASPDIKNIGWRVTFAGLGINLALGILYSWSVISKGIPEAWGWTESQKSLPYSVACLTFSLVMVLAGRMQDSMGPRLVATLGGVLVGAGMIVASMTTSAVGFIVGFGLLAGAGIGFGYASATPPAVKWFPAAKTGLIAGIVVSGFGLASAYVAPLAKYLTVAYGTQKSMLMLGIFFTFVVIVLSQLLKAPPAGYKPQGAAPTPKAAIGNKVDFTPGEVLCTIQFYLLWFMYACGAGAGLMIIGKMAAIAEQQAGLKLGFVLVAILALGNGGGRVCAGMLSDKLGRKPTMILCFLCQAVLIMLLSRADHGSVLATAPVLAVISALIGANYGANLALFPSISKDFYGLKNFGVNYGLVFTAWGVGGFMLALGAGKVYDMYHTFSYAYYFAVTLLIIASLVTLFVQPPHRKGA